jgi:hypothetical protein
MLIAVPVLLVMLFVAVPRITLLVTSTVPGAISVDGSDTTTAPVVGDVTTWLAVPVTEETPPPEKPENPEAPAPE